MGGGISIRLKESLHSFCSFWNNFEKQMIKLPSCFVQFLLKRHLETFFNAAKTILADQLLFSMCLKSFATDVF